MKLLVFGNKNISRNIYVIRFKKEDLLTTLIKTNERFFIKYSAI